MVKIQIEIKEATYLPKYTWYQGGRITGFSKEWTDIDEDDEMAQVLDPNGNVLNITQKKLRGYDALALSVRSTA